MESFMNQYSLKELARILYYKYKEIYDPTLLKKGEIVRMLKSVNIQENEINELINNDEKFLNLIFLWSNIVFKEKIE